MGSMTCLWLPAFIGAGEPPVNRFTISTHRRVRHYRLCSIEEPGSNRATKLSMSESHLKPYLNRIAIYPIKSLDPIELQAVEVGVRSLLHDREFAMVAENGRALNGKRSGLVCTLRAEFDIENQTVSFSLRDSNTQHTFSLVDETRPIGEYLSEFFGERVVIVRNTHGRLMDIPDVSSVTLVSEASLQSLRGEFSEHTLYNLRLRFRANLELAGVDAFWEETLIGPPGSGTRFRIGEVEMIAVSPRARCNVPPRDPQTGIPDKEFMRRMVKNRKISLPAESHIPEFGSLYHLTINTFLPDSELGKWLRIGDQLEIISRVDL